ncbi:MAG TPA: CpsD/CapB family tyrosine-protein kinase [Verrucomicrobiae bacterium]|nr:CpsD/CapB family tyrosine-protein kinase [Verrucomicrobiae bacterium]
MSRNFEILHRRPSPDSPFRVPAHPDAKTDRDSESPRRASSTDHEIANLVQRIFTCSPAPTAPSTVAFCGVDQGAGCTWVCARASEALARQVPGRVCVVDANLRSPSLHTHFDAERRAGFAEAMKDAAPVRDFLRATCCSHLWLMTSGGTGREPNGALNPDRLRSRLADLRLEFDYVLLDTPPITAFADAALIGRLTDGVILVVASNGTRRDAARVAKESFEAANVPILGAVLNRRTYPIPEALYRRL